MVFDLFDARFSVYLGKEDEKIAKLVECLILESESRITIFQTHLSDTFGLNKS